MTCFCCGLILRSDEPTTKAGWCSECSRDEGLRELYNAAEIAEMAGGPPGPCTAALHLARSMKYSLRLLAVKAQQRSVW